MSGFTDLLVGKVAARNTTSAGSSTAFTDSLVKMAAKVNLEPSETSRSGNLVNRAEIECSQIIMQSEPKLPIYTGFAQFWYDSMLNTWEIRLTSLNRVEAGATGHFLKGSILESSSIEAFCVTGLDDDLAFTLKLRRNADGWNAFIDDLWGDADKKKVGDILFLDCKSASKEAQQKFHSEIRQRASYLKLGVLHQRSAPVFEDRAPSPTQDQTFAFDRLALGSVELESGFLRMDSLKGFMTIFAERDVASPVISIPVHLIEVTSFDQENLIAVFLLDSRLSQEVDANLRHAKNCKLHAPGTANCRLERSAEKLRIRFKDRIKNLDWLKTFMRSFKWSGKPPESKNFAHEAFPGVHRSQPNISTRDGKSFNNSTFNSQPARVRTDTTIVQPKPSAQSKPVVKNESQNSTKVSKPKSEVPAPAVRKTKPNGPRSVASDNASTKSASVSDDNSNDTVYYEQMEAYWVKRLQEIKKEIKSVPEMLREAIESIAKGDEDVARGRTRAATRTGASSSSVPAGDPEPDAMIVTLDEESTSPRNLVHSPTREQMSAIFPTDPADSSTALPTTAHPIFANLHKFPEVAFVNSLVTHEEVLQLASGQMLGDGIVQMSLEFMRVMRTPEDKQKMHIFSYFFFQTYLGSMKSVYKNKDTQIPANLLERLRSLNKNDDGDPVNVFEHEYALIPILHEQHWYGVVLCNPGDQKTDQDPCMVILDSLSSDGSSARNKLTTDLIELWLKTEYKEKYPDKPARSFNCREYPRIYPKVPQQRNGVDCGVFMLRNFAELILEAPIFKGKTGAKPNLSDWYRGDDTSVECIRLNLLEMYYRAAALKRLFVFRDDYIRGIIDDKMDGCDRDEIGEEVDAVLEDSPVKQPDGAADQERAVPEQDPLGSSTKVKRFSEPVSYILKPSDAMKELKDDFARANIPLGKLEKFMETWEKADAMSNEERRLKRINRINNRVDPAWRREQRLLREREEAEQSIPREKTADEIMEEFLRG